MGKKKDEMPGWDESEEQVADPLSLCLMAFGIDPKYVLASSVKEGGAVVVVTVGGEKIRWTPGDPAQELDPVRITGVNPAAAKRKPITGGGR